MAETQPATALHFTEDQPQPGFADIRSDNVDLPKPAAPFPLQHPHALPLQLCTGKVFPAYAQLLLRRRRRHRPPRLGSMRTPVRIVRAHQIWGNHPVMTCENYRGIRLGRPHDHLADRELEVGTEPWVVGSQARWELPLPAGHLWSVVL